MADGLGGAGNQATHKQQMGEGGEEHEVGEWWTRHGDTITGGWEHSKLSLGYCATVQLMVETQMKSQTTLV
ncbi:hypothetical protein TIFTF001_055029 [Ficus carica]|uniref:Uncharacterized protein n=1 Tax=Ficus carica TaxID=3494 RepID=A0AA88JJ40_FICCA|nr:hypothetical protein TIFTF001_055026 [Ficus carica]GMN74676.1 hypothetical protein TIFTF001_055027 [Ficus carica]GMN74681.1 hypothetical protein TIFTF001_055028 [Ficus carica]GMN74686.1 hypothetical protein TIFTF001_055029 [Ficus carica]